TARRTSCRRRPGCGSRTEARRAHSWSSSNLLLEPLPRGSQQVESLVASASDEDLLLVPASITGRLEQPHEGCNRNVAGVQWGPLVTEVGEGGGVNVGH